MIVVWMQQAEDALNCMVKYINGQFGRKAAERLLREAYRNE